MSIFYVDASIKDVIEELKIDMSIFKAEKYRYVEAMFLVDRYVDIKSICRNWHIGMSICYNDTSIIFTILECLLCPTVRQK